MIIMRPSNWNPHELFREPQIIQGHNSKKKIFWLKQTDQKKNNQIKNKKRYKCETIKKAFFLLIKKGRIQIKIEHNKGKNNQLKNIFFVFLKYKPWNYIWEKKIVTYFIKYLI